MVPTTYIYTGLASVDKHGKSSRQWWWRRRRWWWLLTHSPFRVQTSLFEPQPQPQPNPTLDLPLGLSSQDLDSPPPHATMQRERDLRAGKQERERGRRSSSFWSCSSVAGTQTGNFAACVQPALFSPLPRSQAEGARYAAWCVCCLNCWGRKTKRWKKANRRFSHHHHIQGVVVWKH